MWRSADGIYFIRSNQMEFQDKVTSALNRQLEDIITVAEEQGQKLCEKFSG
jgi:hypothetical protein